MSAERTYILRCDEPLCPHWYMVTVNGACPPLCGDVRMRAATDGWSHVLDRRPPGPTRSLDYCRHHRETGQALAERQRAEVAP